MIRVYTVGDKSNAYMRELQQYMMVVAGIIYTLVAKVFFDATLMEVLISVPVYMMLLYIRYTRRERPLDINSNDRYITFPRGFMWLLKPLPYQLGIIFRSGGTDFIIKWRYIFSGMDIDATFKTLNSAWRMSIVSIVISSSIIIASILSGIVSPITVALILFITFMVTECTCEVTDVAYTILKRS